MTAGLDELRPEQVTLAKGAIAGGTSLLVGLVAAPWPAVPVVAGALAVGALGYGASITLWVAGARDLGAARGQLIFATVAEGREPSASVARCLPAMQTLDRLEHALTRQPS